MGINDRNSLWQRLFLSLLMVCIAQSSYWVVEQIARAQEHRDAEISIQFHLNAIEEAEASGPEAVSQAALQLLRDPGADQAMSANEGSEAIVEAYLSRRNRILWEGAFFVFVLLGTMGVISKALRDSRRLVQRQQNFIASVTHELRTPLTSLKLSADTLGMRAPDQEHATRLAQRMTEDVERLDQMVSQILNSARVDAKKATRPTEPVALKPLLSTEVHRLHCRLAPTGTLLSLDCPDGIYVSAHPSDFKIVISNLLSNAVKSCAAAGGGLTKLHVELGSKAVIIRVNDSGRGFEEDEAEHLFKRFYRPGNELRRETSGSGLGLYLVYEISKAHGASVTAESPGPGLGATFTLTWPTTPAPAHS